MQTISIKNINEINTAAKALIEKTISLARTRKQGLCLAFYGEMGVGKTSLIKAICKEMGVEDIVTSPSFALINEYISNRNEIIYHFDFYRIEKIEEIFDFGYEDYFYSNNYCFIEWPEKIESLLPENCISVYIKENSDNSRTLKFETIT